MQSPQATTTAKIKGLERTRPISKRDTQQLLLTVLIIVASCVRVLVCLQHNPIDGLWSDPLRHWLNGATFPRGGYCGASDPIGYQVYIFSLRRVARDNRILIALACALLSVVMPWTYYGAARSLGVRKTPALWVWVVIAWTPSLFTIYHYIMMETLLLVLDGAAVWSTGRYLRKGDTWSFINSVFWWTLACLTKPTVIPLAGVFVLWSFWKKRPSLRAVFIATLVAVVMLIPQAVRSNFELGFVAPFGNPWLTKIQHRSGAKMIYLYFRGRGHPDVIQNYNFGSPTCFMQPLAPFSPWRIRRAYVESSITVTASAKNGALDWKNAYAGLNTTTQEWLAQWEENIVVFLFGPSWPESASGQWDSQLTFYTRWMWAPLIAIMLGWNIYRFLKGWFDLLPIAVTVFTLFLLLQNVATAEGRYRKPLEPLLLMNAVWLITRTREDQPNPETAA
jgi:hypothetical protein